MIGIKTFGLSGLLRTNFYGTLQKLYSYGFGVLEPCILFDEYSFAPMRAAMPFPSCKNTAIGSSSCTSKT